MVCSCMATHNYILFGLHTYNIDNWPLGPAGLGLLFQFILSKEKNVSSTPRFRRGRKSWCSVMQIALSRGALCPDTSRSWMLVSSSSSCICGMTKSHSLQQKHSSPVGIWIHFLHWHHQSPVVLSRFSTAAPAGTVSKDALSHSALWASISLSSSSVYSGSYMYGSLDTTNSFQRVYLD